MIRPTIAGQRLLFESESEARFNDFDRANPHIFAALCRMALELRRAGHAKWGMRNLYEKLRYDLAVQTTDKAPVLNNDFAPMYARKLMAEVSELAGFFELRERH